VVLPLLISAAVAPLVLLRSDQSVALGVNWHLSWENAQDVDNKYNDLNLAQKHVVRAIAGLLCAVSLLVTGLFVYSGAMKSIFLTLIIWPLAFLFFSGVLMQFSPPLRYPKYLPDLLFLAAERKDFIGLMANSVIMPAFLFGFIVAVPIGLVLLTLSIRIGATTRYLRHGIAALPRNFRRLVFCTSPAQIPELVPGLNATESRFTFKEWLDPMVFPLLIFFFLPPWLYRLTIKSTAWFWWPLAFLGGDLKRVQDPDLFKWEVMGSLWAKTSITLAILSLVTFAVAHLGPLVFAQNELLVPMARLLLIDWSSLWSWQVCALLASVLSIAIVYLVDDVSWRYQLAKRRKDAKLLQAATSKYGWIERLTRFRFLLLVAFWGLVGTHAFLYANSQQCWFSLSPALQGWAQEFYGDRLPHSDKCPQ
jgi:hypothetical protein